MFWTKRKRDIPTARSLDTSVATMITAACEIADTLIALAPPGHVLTVDEIKLAAAYVSQVASERIRSTEVWSETSPAIVDLFAAPLEAEITAAVIAHLHSKLPLAAMLTSGSA